MTLLSTMFLAQLIGSFLVILSITMMIQGKHVRALLNDVSSHQSSIFILGLAGLILGLILVLTHNDWSDGFVSSFITLMGWVAVIKSVLTIGLPQSTIHRLIRVFARNQVYTTAFVICLIVGLYLAFAGFTSV